MHLAFPLVHVEMSEDNEGILRLYGITTSGTLYVWQWFNDDYCWLFVDNVVIKETQDISTFIINQSGNENRIIFIKNNKLFSINIKLPTFRFKSEAQHRNALSSSIEIIKYECKSFELPKQTSDAVGKPEIFNSNLFTWIVWINGKMVSNWDPITEVITSFFYS